MQDGHPYRRMGHTSLISGAGQNLRFGSWMAMARVRGNCSRVHMETVFYKCSGHPPEIGSPSWSRDQKAISQLR
jgi:hypothetical protein